MRHVVMSGWTPIFIACGPLANAGKTLSARLFLEFCRASGRSPLAFDVNPHDAELAATTSGAAHIVNLSTTAGQMRLFEGMLQAGPEARVVDLWHGSYEPFLDLMEQMEFASEAARRDFRLVLLLHGRSLEDLDIQAEQLRARINPAETIVVLNEHICESAGPSFARFEHSLSIPVLAPSILQQLARMRLGLVEGIDAERGLHSMVARSCLRDWLTQIFAQFHCIELRHRLGATTFNPG
ncbi:hypothetical protein IMF23_00415 [Chelatococcus daeguensis]|uniref:hypothetical protein n=1 Tax=Chelatococcus daeguensis TaxID=444444 RepID=UPI0007ABD17C|nr:hypothetical protein [Chelatococcus daeguensis]KZE30543.1 hypothetical protein AVW15_02420 [Chelatococcus daeguensis]MBM3081889.1 hypothetical protein [Chelatococcus daeguensis]